MFLVIEGNLLLINKLGELFNTHELRKNDIYTKSDYHIIGITFVRILK